MLTIFEVKINNLITLINLGIGLFSLIFSSVALAIDPQDIAQQAKQTTVKITTSDVGQSGILITQDNTTYWVLTCTPQQKSALNKAQIITHDNQSYRPIASEIIHLEQFPVSLIPVTINRSYQTANIGDSSNQLGKRVYMAGFMPVSSNSKLPQFLFTEGIISSVLEQPNQSAFTHTNPIYPGMEGTPIFNQQGALIGIHCQNYPVSNRQKKEIQLNWGIPINPLAELAQEKGLSFGFSAFGSPPPSFDR